MRRGELAGLLAIGAVAGVLALGWSVAPAPPADPSPAQQAGGVLEAGRGLYVANCATCHGSQGEGTDAGPTLRNAGAAGADFYLRTGRMPLAAPGQPAIRQPPIFSDQQIRELVAYVASLGNGPAIPQVASGGDIRRGWALFQANCAACHAATGAGNAIGGGFVASNLGEARPETIAEATLIGPGAMPVFDFSDGNRADLIAYIQWLQADQPHPGGTTIGGIGPVAEGFVGVAVGLPLLVLAALFVGRHARHEEARPAGGVTPDGPVPPRVDPGPEAPDSRPRPRRPRGGGTA